MVLTVTNLLEIVETAGNALITIAVEGIEINAGSAIYSGIHFSLIDGTLFGICFCFWMMIVIAVWRWFLGIVKRFLHWLNPKWFKSKTEETDKN